MTLPSIRRRLARTLLALSLAWGLAVSVVVWLSVRHEVSELLDDTLHASSDVMLGLLRADPALLRQEGTTVTAGPARNVHFAWQLVGPGSRVVRRSALAPAEAWRAQPREGFFEGNGGWRVFGAPFDDAHMLYVGQTRAERREALGTVAASSVLAALAVGALVALGLRQRLRRELQPVTATTDALARYQPLEPGAVLAPAEREELRPVHDAVQALGRRLALRVAGERAFTAHAAHALRTPLAGIDAQLAVALREAPPALAPRLQRVRAAAGRLGRVVGALLALFRTGAEPAREAVDVPALLTRLPFEGVALDVAPGWEPLHADPDLLAAALLNLLDNAARHGATRVRVLPLPHGLRLHDDGAGTDPARRAALQAALDAGAGDDSAPGGLGLRLADLVARAHGGRLQLPAGDGGFIVDLHLGPPPYDGAP